MAEHNDVQHMIEWLDGVDGPLVNVIEALIDELDDYRRTHHPLSVMQCGAPSTYGRPCLQQRLAGKSGCRFHPNWRNEL